MESVKIVILGMLLLAAVSSQGKVEDKRNTE